MAESRPENVSYLRARDPSILAFNIQHLNKIKINLDPLFDESKVVEESKENEKTCLNVFLRIKQQPLDLYKSLYQYNNEELICYLPEGSHAMRNNRTGEQVEKLFKFSHIFGPETSQVEMFHNVVKLKILKFINGENSTLMTYGTSGSGKTFTIVGTDADPGLIPRSLNYLFKSLPELSRTNMVKPSQNGNVIALDDTEIKKEFTKRSNLLHTLNDRTFHLKMYKSMQEQINDDSHAEIENLDELIDLKIGVWVSYAEIYNENVYDLLQPSPPRGKPKPTLKLCTVSGDTYIKNLSSVCVTSGEDAYQILQYGIHNLNYAETNINAHSSRSHSIFTIKIAQECRKTGSQVSSFNFCDLAGSERSKKTNNVGDRLKESNNINTSLTVLSRCINAVRKVQQKSTNETMPFRESKLTLLFQKALSGHEDISMIVNINPVKEYFDETQHVLNFSAVAKEVNVIPKPIQRVQNRFTMSLEREKVLLQIPEEPDQDHEKDFVIQNLRAQVTHLQYELDTFRMNAEEEEMALKEDIIHRYETMMEKREKYWEDRYEELEMKASEPICNVRDHRGLFTRQNRRKLSSASDVIVINSDSESDSDSSSSDSEINSKLNEVLLENKKLKENMEKLNLKIIDLEHDLETEKKKGLAHKKEIDDLKKTLQEGLVEFRVQEKRLAETEKELVILRFNEAEKETELDILNQSLGLLHDQEEDEGNITDTENNSDQMLTDQVASKMDVFSGDKEDRNAASRNNSEEEEMSFLVLS